uniref:Uncharacterized protein n=1 Tax=Guillardia theta TaxID=55529 RepID=A0A7S4N8P4_GUITH|mmetsp:Transcript_18245/g.59925  ORF Transcript_18245/g.59925 Transcript_18245/m.59925 type:complete len:303 (+) Transcript_18245:404-1312(+)
MYTKAVIEKVDNTLRKIEARASKSSDIKQMCKTAEEAGAHDGELKKEKYNNFLDESITRIPPLVSMSESTSSGSSPSPGTHVTRTPHGYSCLAAQREQNESPETKFRINSEIHRVGGQNWGERRRKNAWDRAYRDCAGIPQIQKVAHLRKLITKLQQALPSEAKKTLLYIMKRYMSGEVTPEQMAELIKQLVDDFNVVVPLESYSTNASSFSDDHSSMGRQRSKRVRTHKTDDAFVTEITPKRLKEGDASAIVGKTNKVAYNIVSSKASHRGKPREVQIAPDVMTGGNAAWEALLSVCSRIR